MKVSAKSKQTSQGKHLFLIDSQVFNSKLNNFWWLQPKVSENINTYLDHTYSALVSGKNESFKIEGDWVHQKNYGSLEAISSDVKIECHAN